MFAKPSAPPAVVAPEIRRLTGDGFAVSGPRIIRRRGAASGDGGTVYYSSQGPHRFPDIRAVALAGGSPSHIESRFEGQALSSDGRWLYYDQFEFDGPVAIVADLYAHDLESGRVRRLSHGARLTDPDIDSTGTRLVAVRAREGGKRLAMWRVGRAADGAPALSKEPAREFGSPGCQYATPRWSPDAARIAAVRQCTGSLPTIVEIAADGGGERVLASGGRNLTPTWSPDGQVVLFVSDREGRRFKLYSVGSPGSSASSSSPALVLDAPGGIMWPDVSADGGTVVFTSLTQDGYDVFSAPLPHALSRAVESSPEPAPAAESAAGARAIPEPVDQTAHEAPS